MREKESEVIITLEGSQKHRRDIKLPDTYTIGTVSDLDREILEEHGCGFGFEAYVWFLLDKSLIVDEANAFNILREKIERGKSVFVLNSDTELSEQMIF